MSKIKISEIEIGDVFGEQSIYRVKQINSHDIAFEHLKSGVEVSLSHQYVTDLLFTADQYQEEVEVGVLDKVWTETQVTQERKKNFAFKGEVGQIKQVGIKTIWSEVGSKPFTVCFLKKPKELSKKAFDEKINKVVEEALDKIEKAKSAKKGVTNVASDIIRNLIKNPVVSLEEPEERVLRGIKLQHESTDGFYQVQDLDITSGENKRLVNLNTIKWLVVDGVKYIVK